MDRSDELSLVGIGRVSRVIGVVVAAIWVAAFTLGGVTTGKPWLEIVLVNLPALALFVRALMIGVRIDDDGLLITSWFRTYRFPRARIDEVPNWRYSGYINRWSVRDVMARHVRMLVLNVDDKDWEFPATAMSRRVADRVVPQLAHRLDAVSADAPPVSTSDQS
ncbi:hypothetical protein ET445_00170 [Agromyces protaetiae]|uniref:PH domain-containing protein n=1 Tax=Agromyces protaetiae TaxID=2509455 RepID=A0A4P6FCB5_9MICO|nr:hypothetical protein [Agromyces protaetiae]QAY71979.1 hypothetical protein ET445_00170 [Agromyces protaetiae]